jgi:hypothetical protein
MYSKAYRHRRSGSVAILAVVAVVVVVIGLAVSSSHGGTQAGSKHNSVKQAEALPVGWHDELNPGVLRRWRWSPPRGRADLSAPESGILRLRLGKQSESGQIPEPAQRTYYWASVYRYLTVDLDRFPVLAVRAVHVQGDNTWWDAIVQEYRGGTGHGPETRASLTNAQVPGLLLFDVGAEAGMTGKKQLRLRLNVAGLQPGGAVDYTYVRFIGREDAARLRTLPDLQKVMLCP